MRIFLLPTSYPNKKYPQKNIFIYEQAKQLSKMGHEVIVLHIEKLSTKQILNSIDKKIKKVNDGFAVRYTIQQKTFKEDSLPELNRYFFLKNTIKLYDYAVFDIGKPDVIYAHFSRWAGYAGSYLSANYNVPLVTMEHYSGLINGTLSKSLKKCINTTVEKSKYFLCVSEQLKKSIMDNINLSKSIYVVPNMIDDCFKYYKKIPHKGFVFCAIGRLNVSKDYETLIKAFIKAFKKEENVFLRIGGDGEEKTKLYNLVKKYDRQNQILFLGALTREETLNEYINCDCFALSSAYETYGIVYREALAVGRPIITTNHGGFSDLEWHSEYGYKVPIKDINLFAEAMNKIRYNYDNFCGKKISELCLNDCSADIIGKKIEFYLLKAIL